MRLNIFSGFRRKKSHFPEMEMMPYILIGLVLIILGWASVRFAIKTLSPITTISGKKAEYLYIPTGAGFNTLLDSLENKKWLKSKQDFIWLARRKNLDKNIHPGRYLIRDDMSNRSFVNMLRFGRQEPVRITIQNTRTPRELAGKLSKKLEPDSIQWMKTFSNQILLDRFGVTPLTLFVLFIPNTYELYWNTSGEMMLEKMAREHKRFWTDERLRRADSLNLTIPEVVTMASIVEKETNKDAEKPLIAGVYINRIKIRMLLQADPTVIFAWQDFTIRRVMKKHTELQNPYNTYLTPGLPPGPICLPSIASIDAVLNAQKHNYIYFCAKDDLSGFHNFAATLDEHNRNARKFQTALNRRNIR